MTELIVELRNLKNNTNWNGFKGKVIDYIAKEDRFIVKLTENKVVKVKPINIFLDNEIKMIEYPKPESSVFVFNGPTIFRVGTTNNSYNNKRKNRNRNATRKTKKKLVFKTECSICMEIMDGNVTLDCGHEMCPTCFAQHSRENHTCPYCRKPFAPKINKKEKMPIQVAEEMISLNVKNYYFDEMHDELNVIIDKLTSKETLDVRYVEDVKASIYAHLSEMSLVMWEDIEEWYHDN